MKRTKLMGALVSAALIATPATQVSADAGDFIAGAIIGGIVGANAKKRSPSRSAKRTVSRPRLPATQEGRLTQTSLNYFGFNAGAVDGQLGRKSRNAISSYQAHMGYPVTGQLSQFERDFLFTSYERAQAGGQLTLQQIASNPQGSRGLLHVYRDQLAGGTTMAAGQVPGMAVAVPGTVAVAATVPQPALPAPQPTPQVQTAAVAPAPSVLPNFAGTSQVVSLASHCNGVSLLTNSNGGFTTVSSMTDPNFALSEQFCLARTYAIAKGEDMAAKLVNVTPTQISQQCESFGPAMAEQVTALASQPMDAVVRSTSSFVLSTGMTPSDLKSTAEICLSAGYRTDNMDVAIGSALLLVALGEAPYGELLGHHLSQGFGTAKRPDLSQAWYGNATNAIQAGAPAVFAPGQPERTGLVQQAAFSLSNGGAASDGAVVNPQPVSTLPTFSTSGN